MSDILRTIIAPESLFMALGSALPIQILYFWLLQRAIPPKSKKMYWGIALPVFVVAVLIRAALPPFVKSGSGIVLSILLPVLLLSGPVVRRFVVCSISMVLMAASELACGIVWVSLTGLEVMNPDLSLAYAPAFLATAVVGYGLVMVPGLLGTAVLCRRFFPADAAETAPARSGSWLRRIVLLPLLQVPFVYILLTVSFNLRLGEAPYVATALGLIIFGVVVDAFMFLQVNRSIASRKTEMEASLLEERLAGYLRESAAVQGLLDDTARLRHDVRNHQAVVATLCKRGEHAAARAYLEDVADSLHRLPTGTVDGPA